MKLIPADAEQQLGFHLVRRRLEALVVTEVGRERVAEIRPLAERPQIERLLRQTAELQEALRVDEPLPLADFPEVRGALRRAQPKDAVLAEEDLAGILAFLGVHRRCYGYFQSRRDRYPDVADLMSSASPAEDLEKHIARIIDPRGRVRDDASPELARLKRSLAQTRQQLDAALAKALREAVREGFAADEQPTIRHGRAVIPVRAEAKRKVQGFVHDVSGSGQTVYIEPAAVLDLNNDVRELELEHAREIRRLLQQLTQHVRSRLKLLREALDLLARFDELQARARLANELDAIVPDLNDAGTVRIVRGRNPALLLHFREEARRQAAEGPHRAPRSVVPLDLELSDEVRTIIITGPNAGGKSVALKTTGLCCLMVACGLPVPCAPGTSLPLFDKLFADIGDQQSIEQDLSTFTSHLLNLRQMLAEADEHALVLIDEAGTGTDPAEGGALAQAVLEVLTARRARTVATTHHGTLKAFAHGAEGVLSASMAFDPETLAPTYVFRTGIPGSSYAFDIARRVGLPESLLRRAIELVGEQKSGLEALIAALDERAQALEARLRETEEALRKAEQVRRSFEARERALNEGRAQILADAAAAAERIVAEANARVERTIREIKEAGAERERTRRARERLERFKREIEEEQQRLRSTLQEAQPPAAAEDAPAGPIRVGDQVEMRPGSARGEVLEIEGQEAVVALGSVRLRTGIERLRKVGGRAVPRRPGGAARVPALTAQRRIDLRGLRVEEALLRVERLIDEAVAAGAPSVEVLHGKGTGALREAVREYLRSRPEVSAIEDAAWNAGGHGVTVVTL